jgi:hypothetical protein
MNYHFFPLYIYIFIYNNLTNIKNQMYLNKIIKIKQNKILNKKLLYYIYNKIIVKNKKN